MSLVTADLLGSVVTMLVKVLSYDVGTVPGTVGHLDGGAFTVLAPATGKWAVARSGAAQAGAGAVAVGMATRLPWHPGPKDTISGLVLQLRYME